MSFFAFMRFTCTVCATPLTGQFIHRKHTNTNTARDRPIYTAAAARASVSNIKRQRTPHTCSHATPDPSATDIQKLMLARPPRSLTNGCLRHWRHPLWPTYTARNGSTLAANQVSRVTMRRPTPLLRST
jgi:hypothetical protein